MNGAKNYKLYKDEKQTKISKMNSSSWYISLYIRSTAIRYFTKKKYIKNLNEYFGIFLSTPVKAILLGDRVSNSVNIYYDNNLIQISILPFMRLYIGDI